MAYHALTHGTVVLDIETSVIPDVSQFLGHIKAPANYRKPESIQKYLEDAAAEESARAALDIDLCRIATIAWWDTTEPRPLAYLAKTEDEERKMLANFAKRLAHIGGGLKELVVFNGLDFDLPCLMRRALYLGVKFPRIPVDRFRHNGVTDIMQELSFNGKLRYRGLDFYCRRFNIKTDDIDNPCDGRDVPARIASGDYLAVVAHNKADVVKTRRLAARLGLCDPEPTPLIVTAA